MKGTKIYSVLHQKCAVCQEGEAFTSKQLYHPKLIDKMPERCSYCGHKFEIEAGFWIGSMYVSYGLMVIMGLFVFLMTWLIYPQAAVWLYIALISFFAVVLAPFTFRTSRMIWMNMFSSYDPLKAKAKKA